MTKRPLFSVITVTRDNATGLARTIASIEAQLHGYPDLEFTVINGGDDPPSRCLIAKCEVNRVIVGKDAGVGIYRAMNLGLSLCSGDYVVFMNAGDIFADDRVLAMVAADLEENGPASVVYGDAFERNADGKRLLKSARRASLLKYGMIAHHQAMFFSRSACGDGYDERFVVGADYELICRLYRSGKKLRRLPFAVCEFERGGLSMRTAMIGRSELWSIQREVLGLGLATRTGLKFLHVTAAAARSQWPNLYDKLRFRSSK